jgi:homospermidine synthase
MQTDPSHVGKLKFDGTLLLIGLGAVGGAFADMLLRFLDMDPKKLVVIDMIDVSYKIPGLLGLGSRFFVEKLTKESYKEVLSKYVSSGDIIVDLSILDSNDVIRWCFENDVRFVSTSMEEWEELEPGPEDRKNIDRLCLYSLHVETIENFEKLKKEKGSDYKFTTAIISHGMNPGLVSHFAKRGLVDIAKKILSEKRDKQPERCAEIERYLNTNDFANLAKIEGVKIIHISERDSQITHKAKRSNEFVNTWSIDGFYHELKLFSEMGWGTHERYQPVGSMRFDYGPDNMLVLPTKGLKTKARSWVPSGQTIGYVITHDEAFSLSKFLTIKDENGIVNYRPTIHFVYMPSDYAIASAQELEVRHYEIQDTLRVIKDKDVLTGMDEVGVLLMGHDYKTWWVGSRLSIETSQKILPGHNPTIIQVACSAVAALRWAIKNKYQGLCYAEALPHDEIIEVSQPYLEPFVSIQSDWDPLQSLEEKSVEDMWQLNSFITEPDFEWENCKRW